MIDGLAAPQVKGVRDIKFYHLVQVDHLLARQAAAPPHASQPAMIGPGRACSPTCACAGGCGVMLMLVVRFSEDAKSGSVSSKMAALLLNSYFPQGPNVTGAKQVEAATITITTTSGLTAQPPWKDRLSD